MPSASAGRRCRPGSAAGLRPSLRDPVVTCEPPPPFPQRRVASAAGLRPHLTIKIDHTLRASAHRAAADEGSSLTQVVEAILDRYLRHGMADGDQAPEAAARAAPRGSRAGVAGRRARRHASEPGHDIGRRARVQIKTMPPVAAAAAGAVCISSSAVLMKLAARPRPASWRSAGARSRCRCSAPWRCASAGAAQRDGRRCRPAAAGWPGWPGCSWPPTSSCGATRSPRSAPGSAPWWATSRC